MSTLIGQLGDRPLLSIKDLVVEFDAADGSTLRAIEGVSLDVHRDEVMCIVGESGSGKTLTVLAAMGLLPRGARVASGSITLDGVDLLSMSPRQLSATRGKSLSMIFQDPMTSLNPVMTIGKQMAEMITIHRRDLSRSQVRDRVVELLSLVRVPNPEARIASYPHELSGGMRQRVMIAMAVTHNPSLLIADEPTTALDVTIQAQVLGLIAELRRREGMAMVFITHDLGVVADVADRVAVMYSGRLVELGAVDEIFASPSHPYTAGLLASLLKMEQRTERAYSIPGQPPSISGRPSGCAFSPRCELSKDIEFCATHRPPLDEFTDSRAVACHFPLSELRISAPDLQEIS
jgi:oligopeptide/dipeptide ABC transporter ATP-binding protein